MKSRISVVFFLAAFILSSLAIADHPVKRKATEAKAEEASKISYWTVGMCVVFVVGAVAVHLGTGKKHAEASTEPGKRSCCQSESNKEK